MLELPDGLYPFIDERLPLAELTMVEAPRDLEALLKSQAASNGVEIIRDEPVELRCRSKEYPDATFLVYWPHGIDRPHASAKEIRRWPGLSALLRLSSSLEPAAASGRTRQSPAFLAASLRRGLVAPVWSLLSGGSARG
jgi:hypothetical protein